MDQDTRGAAGAPRPAPGRGRLLGPLSTGLLVLTMLAVMVAEVLIFVPSIANFRQTWLRQKIGTAAVAGLSVEAGGAPALGPERQRMLLRALDAELIAINDAGVSRLLARKPMLEPIDEEVDLAAADPVDMILGAFRTLLFGGDRTMRVRGPVGDGPAIVELVLPDRALRLAMLIYSRNIFLLSLGIASFAALLVFLAISLFLIRPIRRMTRSMVRFGENPADADRIIRPSGRRTEIGIAEAELADMQTALAQTLREQRHLADLGLAVSKINHDLRNILASAQIVSDRLSDLPDPRVQRFAPMLIRSLDRALALTQSVLSYGRAVESPPVKRTVRLQRLIEDVREILALAPDGDIEFVNAVPDALMVEVDPDQFFRAIGNLCRNAVQALSDDPRDALVRRITVEAGPRPDGQTVIVVEDTGPGLPERARDNLFKAFRGSARAGGTGLGLAIAAEIVEAHGGRIALAENAAPGARFEIHLPPAGAQGARGAPRPTRPLRA